MRGRLTQESVLRALQLPIADPLAEVVAVALLAPLLLSIAIWNGFPLIFYDTGAYILQGLGREFVVERSPVYSLFLSYGGGGKSLWLIAIVQVLLTAFVMVESARCVAPKMGIAAFAGHAGFLSAIEFRLQVCPGHRIALVDRNLEPDLIFIMDIPASFEQSRVDQLSPRRCLIRMKHRRIPLH